MNGAGKSPPPLIFAPLLARYLSDRRRTGRKGAGMQVSSRWRTGALMAGALLVGSVIGSPLAQAVSASLVQIEGGHSTNVAAVSSTGKLSVNAGLTTTPDRQVKTALASPEDSVDILVIQTAN